jgi:hypothetical protein
MYVRQFLTGGLMKKMFTAIALITLGGILSVSNPAAGANVITVSDNQLVVNGEKQPQIFGAEVQYFRLRGGYGKNIPRQKVLDLWNRTLDKLVAAKMNAVSFYIPWDFHEYAEGKFDFTGTVDEDGDGNPDYPSRDVLTFIRLVKEHGIKHVMARPGPYVNAEWGFLGFGAIPQWFHEKYPDSHMQNAQGVRTRLYDYHSPVLLSKTMLWFTTLYNQVLKNNIGPGLPIEFVQIDNETNYLWQSIYNHDYGPNSVAGYHSFLKKRYANDLSKLNVAHARNWSDWDSVQPPVQFGKNLGEDQDWYRYHDESIHSYLKKLRAMWEALGLREPNVIFTLAESYNAAEHGLLPNYVFRNDRAHTGLMTVNLYPKTSERADHPLLNNPFKADLDVKAATTANAAYWGAHQEWAMGPEIQGGWWRGIDVNSKSRQQTYLTVLGHGLKAFFVYYFNEGDNFGVHWSYDKAQKLYGDMRRAERIPGSCPINELPTEFWGALQARMDRDETSGFEVRSLVQKNISEDESLYFDAPLDGQANPRDHYFDLQKIGERVIAPYQNFLALSTELSDDVAIVKDTENHVPNGAGIDSLLASAEWAGGLLGYFLNANINPKILITEISDASEFGVSLLAHIDTGRNAANTLTRLKNAFSLQHRSILNLLGDETARSLGYPEGRPLKTTAHSRVELQFYLGSDGNLSSSKSTHGKTLTLKLTAANTPLFTYNSKKIAAAGCEPILFAVNHADPVGYRCKKPNQGTFYQLGALIFDDYNSSDYGSIADAPERKRFLTALIGEAGVHANLELSAQADQAVAFARRDPDGKTLWITVKTGSANAQNLRLRLSPSVLPDGSGTQYRIKRLLKSEADQLLEKPTLTDKGFEVSLDAQGSDVFVVTHE